MTYNTGTDHPMVPLFRRWLDENKQLVDNCFEHGATMGSLWAAFVGGYEMHDCEYQACHDHENCLEKRVHVLDSETGYYECSNRQHHR